MYLFFLNQHKRISPSFGAYIALFAWEAVIQLLAGSPWSTEFNFPGQIKAIQNASPRVPLFKYATSKKLNSIHGMN